MISRNIRAKFKEFSLPSIKTDESSVIIPTIKGTPILKSGIHAYYFLNFRTSKGLRVTINHKDIILPGLAKFLRANYKTHKYFPKLKSLFQKYHYGFSFLQQIMLMTVPHAVTYVKNSHFLINLWSYFGFLDIDCKNRFVKYNFFEKDNDDSVLGSQQFYDAQTDELYYMSYSLKDSLKRVVLPRQKVFCEISKYDNRTGNTKNVWSGEFADCLHDILINKTRQYCVVCELGLYTDKTNNIIPSSVLVLDLKNSKHWIVSRFTVAAHVQFDPADSDIVYFSNHNFNFKRGSILKILWEDSYIINFRGPASVYKYRLTSDGPKELGVFTEPDLFRLTNFHVFNHRGEKILAATGFPNYIFIADANSMKYIRKIEVNHPKTLKTLYRNIPCIIGTISPSIDGEKIFVQTTRSFQTVDISSGKSEMILNHFYNHSSSNHMLTSTDTDW